jgi:hypothetical protein
MPGLGLEFRLDSWARLGLGFYFLHQVFSGPARPENAQIYVKSPTFRSKGVMFEKFEKSWCPIIDYGKPAATTTPQDRITASSIA